MERGAQSAVRGQDRHAVAGEGAHDVLRDGGGKAWKECRATARGGCFDGMEEARR